MGTGHLVRLRTAFFLALTLVSLGFFKAQAQSNLPTGDVNFVATWNETSNADVTFSGIGSGFDVENKTYLSWCIDMNKDLPMNTGLVGKLLAWKNVAFSSWPQVLHILNHKQGGRADVQLAIWFFTDGNAYLTDAASAMVNAANAAGSTYTPPAGGVGVVVVAQNNTTYQDLIVEVPAPGNEECPPVIKVPSGTVTYTATWNETSNNDITFSGIPAGFDVQNKTYLGWCIEMNKEAKLNTALSGTLQSYTSVNFAYWGQINHILNNKIGGRADVQLAIWYFTDNNNYLTANANAMVQAALAAGANFVPKVGQVAAVVLIQGDATVQNQIIEVPVTNTECPPTGGGTGGGVTTPPAGNPPPTTYTANPLTIGYWKNHQAHLQNLLTAGGAINLGDRTITTVEQALAVFKSASAKDARDMLRAQLLGTILNLRNGSDPFEAGADIRPTVSASIQFLATHNTPVDGKHKDRAQAIALKDKLDAYNNAGH
ncbi:MAG TPA: hypothetical protein VEH27_01920 [Methylomirabilota bacterium]|nr:hypothetical protein [Methylomirabilota bacterium]